MKIYLSIAIRLYETNHLTRNELSRVNLDRKMVFGNLPPEYNKVRLLKLWVMVKLKCYAAQAVHGPYDPAVFYGKKDLPLREVRAHRRQHHQDSLEIIRMLNRNQANAVKMPSG